MVKIAEIETGKVLSFDNVIAIRKFMQQEEIPKEIYLLMNAIENFQLHKAGPMITISHDVQIVKSVQMIDMEIIIPVENVNENLTEYEFSSFTLDNALYLRHEGSLANLQESYEKLIQFLATENLQPNFPPCNVFTNDLLMENADSAVIDIYFNVE